VKKEVLSCCVFFFRWFLYITIDIEAISNFSFLRILLKIHQQFVVFSLRCQTTRKQYLLNWYVPCFKFIYFCLGNTLQSMMKQSFLHFCFNNCLRFYSIYLKPHFYEQADDCVHEYTGHVEFPTYFALAAVWRGNSHQVISRRLLFVRIRYSDNDSCFHRV